MKTFLHYLRNKISSITHTVNKNHGLDGSCFELQINVTTLTHLKGWELYDGIVLSECDNILKEDISITLKRSERVATFFSIQRSSSVTKVKSSNR